jgi:DNA-binding CsgD family transcriptional regulator
MTEQGESLSQREREVLDLVATGMTNRQIAQELVVSVNTIKVHMRNIFAKLGVESRTEATLAAIREGWVSVPTEESETETVVVEPGVEQAEPLGLESEVELEPPDLPLPWSKRLALVGFLLLVVVVSIVTWPQPMAAEKKIFEPPESEAVGIPVGESAKWHALAPMITARSHFALVSAGGKLFAIGGYTRGGITGAVERYDPAVDQWTVLATSKPTRVANIGAAVIGERIYVPGGGTAQEEPTDVVDVYDWAEETWSQAAPLPRPLLAYALAVYKGQIYLFGGGDERGYVNTTYIYDPQANEWRAGRDMSTRRAYAAAATVGERIFVIGGYDGRHEQSTCEVYSPEQDTWQDCRPLLLGRGGLGLASVAGRLYAVGGGWSNYLGLSEEYDPRSDSTKPFGTPVRKQWRNLALASKVDKFYAAGGWNGEDYLNNVWKYVVLEEAIFLPVASP